MALLAVRMVMFRGFRLVGSLATCLVAAACQERPVQGGGGPLVYAASEVVVLRATNTAVTLGAAVPGLRTVEIIESNLGVGKALAAPEARSGCVRFPVAISPVALSSTEPEGLAIMDPSCGNWIARLSADGAVASSAWEDVLPSIATESRLSFDDVDGDGDGDIVASSASDLVVLRSRAGTWEATHGDIGGGPFLAPTFVRTMYAVTSPDRFVFQMLGHLELVDVSAASSPVAIGQEVKSVSWIGPFDAFDHLTACPVPLVSEQFRPMLGIGVFGPDAGPVPREIQLLEFKDPRTITISDVGVEARGVSAFAVVPGDGTQDALVGIINNEKDSTRFILAGWKDCRSLVVLSASNIEFNWRTPPAPPNYSEHVLAKRGVVLNGVKTADGATFFHYDGFALRTFSARRTIDGWSVVSMRADIHAERTDVAW